ncbi:MAG TPA: MraY family glycosyltransferase [Actinomycetota bacterium]|nr:MraY family glycosyltransferase [Actinomycetota bacterium]
MRDLRSFLLVAGAAALVTYLMTPVVRFVALKLGAVDRPGGRKVHAIPTPTLGGVAMFAGFLGGLAVAWRMPAFRPLFLASGLPGFGPVLLVSEVLGVAIGGAMMVVIGMVDDTTGLTAPAKLAAQIFVASTMTLFGVRVLSFWLPVAGTVVLSPDLGVPVTVLLIVITVNAVNLVDGLDGLAAGLVGIGALAYFIYSYRIGATGVIADTSPASLLSAVLVGACAGFLPHNFNPARIFMGDSGSMLLGTLLSGATITGIGRSSQPQAGDQFALLIPVAIPLLVLALPFLDTFLAVGRRMRSGKGIMTADKNHLHHRLLEIGHSHRKAVLVLYAWSALLASSAVALSFTGPTRVLPAFLVVVALGVVALLGPRRRLRHRV